MVDQTQRRLRVTGIRDWKRSARASEGRIWQRAPLFGFQAGHSSPAEAMYQVS